MSEGISAVHMDITKNIINYPNNAIAYFGTTSGNLFKSTDSLQTWQHIGNFSGGVVEIMSSNTDPDKVVVGANDGLWISKDGGDSWLLSLETPE